MRRRGRPSIDSCLGCGKSKVEQPDAFYHVGGKPVARCRPCERVREKSPQRRKRAPNGSGAIRLDGYRGVRVHGEYILEHRLVMEQKLGRALWPDETVHHINGDRADNRPENLELWSGYQPPGQRVEDKLAWAREIIARYADTPA